MPSNRLILCRPLLLLPTIFPSIRVFSDESALHIRWPKYWSFSFNISPSNEHSGLISFRIDWLDLLAVQGTLKSNIWQKSLQYCKVISLQLIKINEKKKESSPASQFKTTTPAVFSILYSSTPTSIHDYWKNHSLD